MEADSRLPPQPPQLEVLTALPARDLVSLLLASLGHSRLLRSARIADWALLPRHPELAAGRWPRPCWLHEAARREEALALETFGDGWQERWQSTGSPSYGCVLSAPGIGNCSEGSNSSFQALSIGPPQGVTVMPGSGFLWHLQEPLRPRSFSWLTSSSGAGAGGDGRVGCVSVRERLGLELLRVYFNRGSLWWEKSSMDPIPILTEVKDGYWYHIRCRLDWKRCIADVSVFLLDGEAPQKVNSCTGLGFHGGVEVVTEVLAGSVAFGCSRLSGCQAYLSDLCFS